MVKTKPTLRATLILLAGIHFSAFLCNAQPKPLNFTLDQTYDFNSEEFIVGEVGPIFIDPNNRLFVGDVNQTKFHVFDTNGLLIQSIGSKGEGPGDFAYVSWRTFIHFNDEYFYVTDTFGYYPHRAHAYRSNDLSYSHTITLIPNNKSVISFLTGYEIFQFYQIEDNLFLVSMHKSLQNHDPKNNSVYWMIFDARTEQLYTDPILSQQGILYARHKYVINNYEVYATHTFPFFSKPIHFVTPNGVIYTASSDKLSIKLTALDGKLINTINHPISAPPFNLRWVRDLYIQTGYMPEYDISSSERIVVEMLDDLEVVPERWPELEKFYVDNMNSVWVNVVSAPNEYKNWII
ncbi:MAG TPA: hypothetical protein DCE78_04425, partial [Bacteroidetes bacterium]|nr:hypothetical protein [Bacteroidota bacterium]